MLLLLIAAVAAYMNDSASSNASTTSAASADSAESGKASTSKAATAAAGKSGSSTKSTSAPSTSSSAVSISGASNASSSTAWIPVKKVRGVNLGSLFVFEPWMAGTSWKTLGCDGYDSEWQCIEAVGLDKVQAGFENHWNTFYNATDFTAMASVGLNLVRIPLGFWTVDALIGDDYFPTGSWKYVKQVVGWAKDAGLYVILDLHGAPGSQTTAQAFTGHTVDTAGFFTTDNFQRAVDCLTNWTTEVHTNDIFSTVVMLQVVNEPLQDTSKTGTMLSEFYPNALKAVRDAEAALGISCDDSSYACLGVQYMDKAWGGGDPTTDIDTTNHVVFDDHGYAQWIATEQSRSGYLDYLCTTTRSTDMSPIIVGEWSLSAMEDQNDEFKLDSDGATAFYQQFAAAQLLSAEKGVGWIFWSWKTELGDPRWSYQEAVAATFFPTDLDTI
ncbi:glycoside hydrolase superfamily, partial [Leucosporidium creatinivorum]